MPDKRPIGVFDSGVGGLTVLQALQEQLPDESTVYLGDLARCPYGPRPLEEVSLFAQQIGDLLAGEDIKLLVIACNTATAAAYEILRARYPFPVLGVIEPGAREAVRRTRRGRIAVVATDGTVASGAYASAIHRLLPEARVIQKAASWLVPMIERGPIARATAALQIAPMLADVYGEGIDVLILGCTHFPLVREAFESCAGNDVLVLDSAQTTAGEVRALLTEYDLLATGTPWHRFLVTGPAAAFEERARSMFRFSPPIESIDLAWDYAV